MMFKSRPMYERSFRSFLINFDHEFSNITSGLIPVGTWRHINVIRVLLQATHRLEHVDSIQTQLRIEMKENPSRFPRVAVMKELDLRVFLPVPEFHQVLIVEHQQSVKVGGIAEVASDLFEISQKIERYQREAADNLEVAVDDLDVAEVFLEFFDDIATAADLDLEAAGDVGAAAQFLCRCDAVHVDCRTGFEALADALFARGLVVDGGLHVAGRALDQASVVEGFVREGLGVGGLSGSRHVSALVLGDTATVHKLVRVWWALVHALVVAHHHVLAHLAVFVRRS